MFRHEGKLYGVASREGEGEEEEEEEEEEQEEEQEEEEAIIEGSRAGHWDDSQRSRRVLLARGCASPCVCVCVCVCV